MLPLLFLPLLLLLLLLPCVFFLLLRRLLLATYSLYYSPRALRHIDCSMHWNICRKTKHINRMKIVQTHNLIVIILYNGRYSTFTAHSQHYFTVYLFTNSTGARSTVPFVIVRMLCVAGPFLSIRVSQSHWMLALCNMHGINWKFVWEWAHSEALPQHCSAFNHLHILFYALLQSKFDFYVATIPAVSFHDNTLLAHIHVAFAQSHCSI